MFTLIRKKREWEVDSDEKSRLPKFQLNRQGIKALQWSLNPRDFNLRKQAQGTSKESEKKRYLEV